MKKRCIYSEAFKKWGLQSQMLLAAEECNELSAELLRQFRLDRQNMTKLLEELADVEIMVEQLRFIFSHHNDEFSKIKGQKLLRVNSLLSVTELIGAKDE